MAAQYDSIANQFEKTTQSPFRLHVEEYTYLKMLGDLSGKSILDLACGEGRYSRQIKQQSAATVVGVDISPKMIELARQEEARESLGIEYIVGDVLELGTIGSFDLVVASYLLVYAQTKEQLLKMCQTIYANLKPGGRFVTINGNTEQPPESFTKGEKYGFTKSISEPLQEEPSTTITLTFLLDDQEFSIYFYYFSKATYEWAFRSSGFREVHWQQPLISPQGVQEFGEEFWQDLIDYPPIVGIECLK